ncbi:MAG TPA: ATP-binding cassette domain-containing protein [Candidatus Corynebacterium avicola]|uniref:ATP-binding cassette domain-containing protein n=1 Tax=Candidatus Corynebacterium avicola TaxID=2838527 RepID=A0A9D1UKA5_9CORY|nr:ATP-binding cassette domain-containing protein [Candidatus Corynebacterium avicola]
MTDSPISPIVRLDNVSKTFTTRGRNSRTVHALDSLTFHVGRGELLAVLGPNGAGKTTAINVLSTLEAPDSGTASVDGHDVVADPGAVREAIALTGQFAAVDEELTGRENLVFFGRLRGLPKSDARARADSLLADLSLTEAGDSLVRTYSGGMRRRLDIAASMMSVPTVLFLDEPTTGLDPHARTELWDVVRGLKNQGVTILLTTQYLEEADQLADRIVVIDHGTVIAEGTAEELKSRLGPTDLVLTPEDPADRERLLTELAPWAPTAGQDGTPADPAASADSAGTVAVPLTDGARTAAAVMQAVGASGIALAGMTMGTRTLDDVFFALTGRPTAEERENDAAEVDQ